VWRAFLPADLTLKEQTMGTVHRVKSAQAIRDWKPTGTAEHVRAMDDLNDEVLIARGIEAAIYGIGELSPDDKEMRDGILIIQQRHIERLEDINSRLLKQLHMNDDD
jgi:hypothetical protein